MLLCVRTFNVPVILLTGDQAVTLEAKELIPGIETVEVKKANSRFSADCLHPAITHNMILEAAKDAVKKI